MRQLISSGRGTPDKTSKALEFGLTHALSPQADELRGVRRPCGGEEGIERARKALEDAEPGHARGHGAEGYGGEGGGGYVADGDDGDDDEGVFEDVCSVVLFLVLGLCQVKLRSEVR